MNYNMASTKPEYLQKSYALKHCVFPCQYDKCSYTHTTKVSVPFCRVQHLPSKATEGNATGLHHAYANSSVVIRICMLKMPLEHFTSETKSSIYHSV
jgi:hypothetical protein